MGKLELESLPPPVCGRTEQIFFPLNAQYIERLLNGETLGTLCPSSIPVIMSIQTVDGEQMLRYECQGGCEGCIPPEDTIDGFLGSLIL